MWDHPYNWPLLSLPKSRHTCEGHTCSMGPHYHVFWTCFLVKSYDIFLGCAAVWQYTLAVAVPAPLLPRQLLAHCRTSKLVYLAASSCVKQYCILLCNRTNSFCTVLLYIQWSIRRDIFWDLFKLQPFFFEHILFGIFITIIYYYYFNYIMQNNCIYITHLAKRGVWWNFIIIICFPEYLFPQNLEFAVCGGERYCIYIKNIKSTNLYLYRMWLVPSLPAIYKMFVKHMHCILCNMRHSLYMNYL